MRQLALQSAALLRGELHCCLAICAWCEKESALMLTISMSSSESTETWPVCLQVASCAHWAGSHARPCESTAAYWRPWVSHCGLPTMYHRPSAGLVPAGGDAHSTITPAG